MADYFYKKYDGPMDPYGSWQLEAYKMGPSTNPKADQLKEFNLDANWGAKNIEIGFLSNRELESFPKPAVDEIHRLSKLTGAQPSVHGPVEDPAGFDEFKKEQKEYARRGVVNKFMQAVRVAHDAGGAETPVTFHSSNYLPGDIYSKNDVEEKEATGVMDRETGRFLQLVEKEDKMLRTGETETWTPEMQIDIINSTQWAENVRKLAEDRKNIEDVRATDLRGKELGMSVPDTTWIEGATNAWAGHISANILGIYHDFAKYSPEIEKIKDPRKREAAKELYKMRDQFIKFHKDVDKKRKELDDKARKYNREGKHGEASMLREQIKRLYLRDIDNWQLLFSTAPQYGLTPRRYISVEDYTLEPAAKTFAETALRSYEKYGDKSPHIMIENAPAPGAFSRADKHKMLVEEARNQLVKLSKGKIGRAKAEELIQATLDIGHYGLWRQYGYKNEDIVDMAKKIAPLTGHLHITDNFGSADSHLPPGWGDLPHGEVLELLKRGGFKGKTVIEAGGAEALGYSPYLPSLEYFNSGVYSWAAKPSWTDVGDYFFGSSGYAAPGIPLPYHHQQLYGAGSGFGNLPPAAGVDKRDKSGVSGTSYS